MSKNISLTKLAVHDYVKVKCLFEEKQVLFMPCLTQRASVCATYIWKY